MEALKVFSVTVKTAIDGALQTLASAIQTERTHLKQKTTALQKDLSEAHNELRRLSSLTRQLVNENITLKRDLREREQSIHKLVTLIGDREVGAQLGAHKLGKERRRQLEAHLKAERQRLFGNGACK